MLMYMVSAVHGQDWGARRPTWFLDAFNVRRWFAGAALYTADVIRGMGACGSDSASQYISLFTSS